MGHIKIETVLIEVCHTLYLRRMMACQVAHTQILCLPPPNSQYKVQGILKCGSLHTTCTNTKFEFMLIIDQSAGLTLQRIESHLCVIMC